MSYLRGGSPALIEFFHWIHFGQESYVYMLSLDAWSYVESTGRVSAIQIAL